jgi:hypothetical protein
MVYFESVKTVFTNVFCKYQQNLEREKNCFCRKQKEQKTKPSIKTKFMNIFLVVKENEEFSLKPLLKLYLP